MVCRSRRVARRADWRRARRHWLRSTCWVCSRVPNGGDRRAPGFGCSPGCGTGESRCDQDPESFHFHSMWRAHRTGAERPRRLRNPRCLRKPRCLRRRRCLRKRRCLQKPRFLQKRRCLQRPRFLQKRRCLRKPRCLQRPRCLQKPRCLHPPLRRFQWCRPCRRLRLPLSRPTRKWRPPRSHPRLARSTWSRPTQLPRRRSPPHWRVPETPGRAPPQHAHER